MEEFHKRLEMIESPIRLTAVEYRDRFLSGITKPFLVGALDENGGYRKVVLKLGYPEAEYGFGHYGRTSLACELICSALARFVGLKVPDYAIVRVTGDFANSMPNEELGKLLEKNIGENFGTIFHPSLALWHSTPTTKSKRILDQLEDILTFDATVINWDRRNNKPNLLYGGDDLFLIDHSLAMIISIVYPQLTEERDLFPDGEVYQHCASLHLRGKKCSYNRITDRCQSRVLNPLMDGLRAIIPPSWEEAPGELDKLFAFLEKRGLRCQEIRMHLMSLVK